MACLYFPLLPIEETDEIDMSPESLTTKVEILKERVDNHITFFKFALVVLGGWLAWVSVMLYQTHSAVGNLAQVQANAPAQIASSILSRPINTPQEAESNLSAVSAVLQSSEKAAKKPTATALQPVEDKLVSVQSRFSQIPQVWQTTGVFINYKSEASAGWEKVYRAAKGKTCGVTVNSGTIWIVKNCETSLEEMAKNFHDNTINGSLAPILFVNCIVHYSGGALPKEPLVFSGSIFQFNVPVVPPPRGIQTMQALAESVSLADVKIPS